MLKMIFFDEDPDEVLKEEDISADVTSGVERIDFRDTEEVGTKKTEDEVPKRCHWIGCANEPPQKKEAFFINWRD